LQNPEKLKDEIDIELEKMARIIRELEGLAQDIGDD
jgi:hypothetical protein